MASTGFFARIGNLWRGFWSIWITDREKANPEIAYENAINGMIGKYGGLKRATAAIIGRRADLESRFTERNRELRQSQADLDTAVATGQDDLALVLIQKKGQLEAEVAELKHDLDGAMSEAESAKSSLLQVQGEIKKLRGEKDAMIARLRSAEAKIRIQDQLEGFSIEADVKALDNVREHIKTTVAQANLGKELQEASLDTRLGQLRQQTGDVQARAELERLKAARPAQGQAQGAGKKTL
jgi:phage shock protein A